MKTQQEINDYLLSFEQANLAFPFGEKLAVYRIGDGNDKMFALIDNNSKPVRLSLKCDAQLAEKLRNDYETILPAQNLNKKYWNTIICSGQVSDEDIKSFVILSYNLAKNV